MSLGFSAMLHGLTDNSSTVNAVVSSLGKTIASIRMDDENDGRLLLTFTDDTTLALWDNGRSCCESRYMTCDDELPSFVGASLVSIALEDGPDLGDNHDDPHETQFLRVATSNGTLTVCTHNEHNGYYGGFAICAELV